MSNVDKLIGPGWWNSHMWVCRGQLKTLHTNIGHRDLLFLPEW
jgi:hypothetical protein